MSTELILFTSGDVALSVPITPEENTVWLSQAQMVELYGRDVSVISRHINNVFKEGEVEKESNLHFLQIAGSDRPTAFYSLDVIISVGYRIKSKRGVEFRKWANSVLKDYILRGYAVNEARIRQLGEVDPNRAIARRAPSAYSTIPARAAFTSWRVELVRLR